MRKPRRQSDQGCCQQDHCRRCAGTDGAAFRDMRKHLPSESCALRGILRTCFMSVEPTHDDLRGPSYKEPRNTSVERSAVNREGTVDSLDSLIDICVIM